MSANKLIFITKQNSLFIFMIKQESVHFPCPCIFRIKGDNSFQLRISFYQRWMGGFRNVFNRKRAESHSIIFSVNKKGTNAIVIPPIEFRYEQRVINTFVSGNQFLKIQVVQVWRQKIYGWSGTMPNIDKMCQWTSGRIFPVSDFYCSSLHSRIGESNR